MDFRFLLVLILPAFATAGTYSDDLVPFGVESEGKGFGSLGADKGEPDYTDYSGSGSATADVLEGGSVAHAAVEEYAMKAKVSEQSARWFRNMLSEKQVILKQVKKRLNLLRAMAAENLQSAEQYRQSAAEKTQSSKALEAKAREAQSLSKEYAVQVNELRVKMNNELKQYLESQISSRVAEANANTDRTEMELQRSWAAFLEKQAQEMISEALKWEQRSAQTLDLAKKLKLDAAAESSKAKELEKKKKEVLEAANEAEKKANDFYHFHLEFQLKSQAEELHGGLAKIKAKYHQMLASSLSDSASYLHMFANYENKDGTAWQKKSESVRNEAKLLEASANKMFQNIEKLKASLKLSKKKEEPVVQEEKVVKAEPVPQPNVSKKV